MIGNLLETGALRRARDQINEAGQLLNAVNDKFADDLGLTRHQIKDYSLVRAIAGVLEMYRRESFTLGGPEGEYSRALAAKLGEPQNPLTFYVPPEILRRDLTAGTASAGGYLVATETGGTFIEARRNASFALRFGAQRVSGLRNNIAMPRQSTAATGYWLNSEAAQVTESTPTFQQVNASPKTVAGYVEISDQLIKQSNPSVEAIVFGGLGKDIGVATDNAVANGTGVSGQPTGILNTSGIGSVSGTSFNHATVCGMQTTILDNNAAINQASLGFVTTPTIASLLNQRMKASSTFSPLWEGSLAEGSIENMRAMSSLQIPAGTMIFGDFSQILILEFGTLMIEVNPFANFQARIVGVRAMLSCDVIIRHPQSFVTATSIT